MHKATRYTHDGSGPRVELLEADPSGTDARCEIAEPIRRLADATLWAAIQDASGDDERHACTAVRWLLGDADEGFSLESCCARLGLAPDSVVSSVVRHYPAIRLRVAEYRRIAMLLGRPVDGD